MLIVITAALAGCQLFIPPHDTMPHTEEAPCGTTTASTLTALVPAFALLAAASFYEAKQPAQPPPATCGQGIGLFGGPSCTPSDPAPRFRGLGWASVVAGSATAVAAAASWAHVARCKPDDHRDEPAPAPMLEHVEAVSEVSELARAAMLSMDAGDCATARSAAARVRALDPVYYTKVVEPVFGACMIK